MKQKAWIQLSSSKILRENYTRYKLTFKAEYSHVSSNMSGGNFLPPY